MPCIVTLSIYILIASPAQAHHFLFLLAVDPIPVHGSKLFNTTLLPLAVCFKDVYFVYIIQIKTLFVP